MYLSSRNFSWSHKRKAVSVSTASLRDEINACTRCATNTEVQFSYSRNSVKLEVRRELIIMSFRYYVDVIISGHH